MKAMSFVPEANVVAQAPCMVRQDAVRWKINSALQSAERPRGDGARNLTMACTRPEIAWMSSVS
jgi:hypothetical protein